MRIGIIGCGYVGQAAALYWKQKEHTVSVTTRRPERISLLQSLVDNVYLLTNPSLKEFILQQEALLISVAPDTQDDYHSTYLHTASEVAQHGAHLQTVLYTSSTSVYGEQEGSWVDETLFLQPAQIKDAILHQTEQVLLENLQACILRLGEIYGPGRDIGKRLRRMQQPFAGTGESYTNLIHLNDVVNALDFALNYNLKGIFNLCNDFHIPRRDFYEQICQQEMLPPVQWDPSKMSTHAGNKRVSNQKIKSQGFVFSHPMYEYSF